VETGVPLGEPCFRLGSGLAGDLGQRTQHLPEVNSHQGPPSRQTSPRLLTSHYRHFGSQVRELPSH
jgi:hypothetical protein